MSAVRIAAIGAGSFVFGPSLLAQGFLEHALPDLDFALMDVDAAGLAPMVRLGQRMAADAGVASTLHGYTDRRAALAGADFVLVCAAPGHPACFRRDTALMDKHAPGLYPTHFSGITGLGYALRQLAFFDALLTDMHALCPGAWLFALSNPLPPLALLAHRRGIRTIGFCSAAVEGYSHVWQLLHPGSPPLPYPYTEARAAYRLVCGGTNHLSWVTGLADAVTGADLLPSLRAALDEGRTFGQPLSLAVSRKAGALVLPNDHHLVDFVEPHPDCTLRRALPTHGTEAERAARIRQLHAVAEGTLSYETILQSPSWERPMEAVAGLAYGRTCRMEAVNLVHDAGQVPGLPEGCFVETPCVIAGGKAVPERIELPPGALAYCQRAAALAIAMVEAFEAGTRESLRRVVEVDPTLPDKDAAWCAVEAILQADAERLAPRFAG